MLFFSSGCSVGVGGGANTSGGDSRTGVVGGGGGVKDVTDEAKEMTAGARP